MSQTTHFLVLSLRRKPEMDAYAVAKQLFCCYYSVIDELHIQNNAYLEGVLKEKFTQGPNFSHIASSNLKLSGLFSDKVMVFTQGPNVIIVKCNFLRQLCVPYIEQLTRSRFIQITSVKIGTVFNYNCQLYLQAAISIGFGCGCPSSFLGLGCGGYSLIFARNWSFGYIQDYSFCLKTIRK